MRRSDTSEPPAPHQAAGDRSAPGPPYSGSPSSFSARAIRTRMRSMEDCISLPPTKVQPNLRAASAVPARSSMTGSHTVWPGRQNRSSTMVMAASCSVMPPGSSSRGGTSNRSCIPSGLNSPLP